MTKNFEQIVRDEIVHIYEQVDATDIKRHDVSININANVDYKGNITIGYNIKRGYSDATKGATLIAVFDEFLRRQGWNKRNAPTTLLAHDNVIEGELADEIIQPPELTNQ